MTDQVETETELSPEQQKLVDAVLAQHEALPAAQAEVDKILARRRAAVLRARAVGVSGYRLAKVMGVSQTTISNISQ